MSTFIESGHARNLASLQKLIQLTTQLGANYNPTPSDITVTGLTTLFNNADASATTLKNAVTSWKNSTNSRELAFDPLPAFGTKLLGVLKSYGVPQQTANDFAALVHKLRGDSKRKPIVPIAPPVEPPSSLDPLPPPPTTTEPLTRSTSQRSFDNIIEHFDKMIKLLASVTSYNPSEPEFQIANLNIQLANLKAINDAANLDKINLSLARIDRNKIFYADITGMLEIARKVKDYIKGKFGATSQEYKAALAIVFVRVISKKKAR